MITRPQAVEILHKNIQNANLRRHCYAVEAVMRALYKRLESSYAKATEDKWGIAGLLHDADWEVTKEDPAKHTHLVTSWIAEIERDGELEEAILSHGWGYVEGNPKPKTKMQWALYACDELTGFIVAVALVKPDKKLSMVTVDSVLRKWNEKSFAKNVNRDQIKQCEGELSILLPEFIEIALIAMQNIAVDLGL
ncbi:MAG: phosphohydrolase [Patescibacteria group bacterium]